MTLTHTKALQPELPPGRANRKALAYTHEIQRLRALGYTFGAIRLALLAVGVEVGLTTVKREAARVASHARQPASTSVIRQPHHQPIPPSDASAGSGPGAARRSGKDIAEAFAQSHVEHPLLKEDRPRTGAEEDPS